MSAWASPTVSHYRHATILSFECIAANHTQHTNNTNSNIVRIGGAALRLSQTSRSHASSVAPELFGISAPRSALGNVSEIWSTRPGADGSTFAVQHNTANTCRPAVLPRSWPKLANPKPPVDNIGLDPAVFREARIDQPRERERQMNGKFAATAQERRRIETTTKAEG